MIRIQDITTEEQSKMFLSGVVRTDGAVIENLIYSVDYPTNR